MSRVVHSEKVVFCENGAQMLDIMLGSIAYDNAVTTKNTDPRYLNAISTFLCNLDNSRFTIEYALKNKTKSEAIAEFLNKDLLQKSWSCYSTRMRSKMCGSCWNCFTTRMSAKAAGFSDVPRFEADPLSDTSKSPLFSDNQRILYSMLVFYSKVINQDKEVIAELNKHKDNFTNPAELANRFGLDLYLGILDSLSNNFRRNGLGKKAEELLSGIDRSILEGRREILTKLHSH